MFSEKSNNLPVHSVLTSPGGELHYCKPIPINRYNPYLTNYHPGNNVEDATYRDIECNGEIISIPAEEVERALVLHWRASLVRLLCLIDFAVNIVWTIHSYYGAIYSLWIAFFSLVGFYSTFVYSRGGLLGYLLYQYLQSIAKIMILSLYISAYTSQKSYIFSTPPVLVDIIMASAIMLGQLYITYFIQSFYNLLPPTILYRDSTEY